MLHNVRSLLPELAGLTTTCVAAITARQEQIEWYLRNGASVVALIAGLLTIRSLLKKHPVGKDSGSDKSNG